MPILSAICNSPNEPVDVDEPLMFPLEVMSPLMVTCESDTSPCISELLIDTDVELIRNGAFINDNNRISAYVRFDHSEELFLGSMNSSDFSQETISTDGRIPDVVYALDNIDSESNNFHSFGGTENRDQNKEKQVAFVKCSIDSNFYYAPKLEKYTGEVYNAVSGVPEVTQPIEVYSDNEEYQTVMTNARTHFIPTLTPSPVGESNGILDFVTNTTEFENKKIH